MSSALSPQYPDRHWLIEYVKIQKDADKRVAALLQAALDESQQALDKLDGKPGIGATVRRGQILNLRAKLLKIINGLFRAIGDEIRLDREEASALAANLMFEDESVVWKIIESDEKKREALRKSLEDQARRNIEARIQAEVNPQTPTLSRRIYKSEALAKGQVTKMVNKHLALGSSAADLAKDVRQFINPKTPGGVSYRAKMLARTEIINAFHAQAVSDFQGRPWVKQAQWNLSKSHNEQGCVCEKYAEQRLFPAGDVPKRPHPGCLCTVTPDVPDRDTALKEFMTGQYAPWLP